MKNTLHYKMFMNTNAFLIISLLFCDNVVNLPFKQALNLTFVSLKKKINYVFQEFDSTNDNCFFNGA